MIENKIVHFNFYCPSCKYADTNETDDPCTTCLCYGGNVDSHLPVSWEPGDMSKWHWGEIQFNTDALRPREFFQKLHEDERKKRLNKCKGG